MIIFWEDIHSHVGRTPSQPVIMQQYIKSETQHWTAPGDTMLPCCTGQQTMANCGQYQEYLFKLLIQLPATIRNRSMELLLEILLVMKLSRILQFEIVYQMGSEEYGYQEVPH